MSSWGVAHAVRGLRNLRVSLDSIRWLRGVEEWKVEEVAGRE
jgi:hypothetical protein